MCTFFFFFFLSIFSPFFSFFIFSLSFFRFSCFGEGVDGWVGERMRRYVVCCFLVCVRLVVRERCRGRGLNRVVSETEPYSSTSLDA